MGAMCRKRKVVCLILAMCLIVCGMPLAAPASAEASSPPAYNAKLTQKNMLRLMRAYDGDAYYILKSQDKAGDSFATWMRGSKRLVDAVDVTVHEEFHKYASANGGYARQGDDYARFDLIYLGGKKASAVVQTKVFPTVRATRKIPKRYRTFRYSTYVSTSTLPYTASNEEGVYGLLNEFSAYYWGMHASESLYPYIKKHVSSSSGYESFASDFMNDRDAYAEFYYWTLVYLDYARQHKPKVYKGILANDTYTRTFKAMRSKYQKLIRAYKKDLDKVCKKFNHGAGFSKSYNKKTGVLRLGGSRWVWQSTAYDLLAGQISSTKYAKVRKALANAS